MNKLTLAIALLLGAPATHAVTVVAVDTPENTVKRINANYNAIRGDCKDPTGAPRGYYYCSGVTVRMVDDGPFNPWDYSPYALKTGASSFSWIRADLSTNRLIRPAGFILRTPEDARRLKAPVMETGFMCIYSFDGFTGPERQWHGCGPFNAALPANHQARSATTPANLNAALAWGSCDSLEVNDAEQWRRRWSGTRPTLLNPMNRIQVQQCSWNAEQPSDWDAMIKVHQAPGTRFTDTFARKELINEFLLRNDQTGTPKSDGSARLPYIDAFVWDPNSTYVANTRGDTSKAKATVGLKPAQAFQRKLYAQGYAVPVLRMDFTRPPSERFSYVADDQVVPLGGRPQAGNDGQENRDYIDSATWIRRHDPGMGREEWTLNVVLKPGVKIDASNVQAAYEALESRYGDGQHWRENEIYPGSMRAQVECLVSNYPGKSEWNLEPFRPTVNPDEMKRSGCNPVRKLIEAALWSEQTDSKSGTTFFGLQVVPTQIGRQASSDDLYAELFRQRGRDEQWQEGVAGSVKLQLACLRKNYSQKKDWNLEPFRKATSPAQTEAALCNP
ncbi:DUF2599 domain-containing protein [Pseudomonas xantholysinigenes]|uniref:DUF2599 domain-containing protein n=1 Tax=Pseudomonas xantholysinigenes TaxID=2745490 RepID=A0A9E6Q0A2_9PSED|nr:DUF2599 domain-containing protein [Pseudomonas xantholysinigenes]QXI40651.1 DUF2599 domain-containing protein [Pseudomonas xantholysinigenes]